MKNPSGNVHWMTGATGTDPNSSLELVLFAKCLRRGPGSGHGFRDASATAVPQAQYVAGPFTVDVRCEPTGRRDEYAVAYEITDVWGDFRQAEARLESQIRRSPKNKPEYVLVDDLKFKSGQDSTLIIRLLDEICSIRLSLNECLENRL